MRDGNSRSNGGRRSSVDAGSEMRIYWGDAVRMMSVTMALRLNRHRLCKRLEGAVNGSQKP